MHSKSIVFKLTPLVLQDLSNRNSLINIAVQHQSHQIDACIAHDIWNSEIVIHDLVDGVEGVFFVDDCVEEYAKSPDILFLASVGLAG
jgi:hypothetical protein